MSFQTTYGNNFKYVVPRQGMYDAILSINDKKISKTGTNIGEDGPEMFTWKMLYGTRSGLKDPQSVMISESTSLALFGDSDPTGKSVVIDNEKEVIVSGVFEDFPRNSELYGIQFARPWGAYLVKQSLGQRPGMAKSFFPDLCPDTAYDHVRNGRCKYQGPRDQCNPQPCIHAGLVEIQP